MAIKDAIIDILKSAGKGIVEDLIGKGAVKTPFPDEPLQVSPALPSIAPSGRFIQLTPEITFVRKAHTTTFCNDEDFKTDRYMLASGKTVTRESIQGLLGVSLSYELNANRIVSIFHPMTGRLHSYGQVDVGPGWTDDNWWITKTNPKNESGLDHLGHKSPKSALDVLPSVLVDMGLLTWEKAFNESHSFDFDILIYEPKKLATVPSLIIPSSDKRPWFATLPSLGTDKFTWNELLRGWNKTEAPSKECVDNLAKLTKEILLPAREALGRLRVNSGLRDIATNTTVGGRDGSLHTTGRAVDLHPLDVSFEKAYDWMRNGVLKSKFRECIWEQWGHTSREHLHVGGPIKSNEVANIKIKP